MVSSAPAITQEGHNTSHCVSFCTIRVGGIAPAVAGIDLQWWCLHSIGTCYCSNFGTLIVKFHLDLAAILSWWHHSRRPAVHGAAPFLNKRIWIYRLGHNLFLSFVVHYWLCRPVKYMFFSIIHGFFAFHAYPNSFYLNVYFSFLGSMTLPTSALFVSRALFFISSELASSSSTCGVEVYDLPTFPMTFFVLAGLR